MAAQLSFDASRVLSELDGSDAAALEELRQGERMIVGAQPEYPEDLGAGERAALVATWLQGGRVLSTAQAARLLGLKPHGAWRLMDRVSGVLPIRQDDGGLWRWVEDGDGG